MTRIKQLPRGTTRRLDTHESGVQRFTAALVCRGMSTSRAQKRSGARRLQPVGYAKRLSPCRSQNPRLCSSPNTGSQHHPSCVPHQIRTRGYAAMKWRRRWRLWRISSTRSTGSQRPYSMRRTSSHTRGLVSAHVRVSIISPVFAATSISSEAHVFYAMYQAFQTSAARTVYGPRRSVVRAIKRMTQGAWREVLKSLLSIFRRGSAQS